jgi:hypothetical protein
MMQIGGPLPVSPVGKVLPVLEIKPFQRVTAEILQVTGSQAILSIDGIPVVAEVPSGEIAADLKGRSSAQFIVTQLEDGKTILRLANPSQVLSPSSGQPADGSQNLTLHLLNELGLSLNAANQTAVQAAINQRLALQPGQMDLLLRTLEGLPGWDAQDANLAAAILVAGLPLTPESLELAAKQGGLTTEKLDNLVNQLRAALQDPGVPTELVRTVYQTILETVVDAGLPAGLPEKLAHAVQLLGRPIENLLLEEALTPTGRQLASVLGGVTQPQPEVADGYTAASQTVRQDLAGPMGKLQSALQNSTLTVEIKEFLSGIYRVLEETTLSSGVSTPLAEKMTPAEQVLRQLLQDLTAEQMSASGSGGAAGTVDGAVITLQPGAAHVDGGELTRQMIRLQAVLQNSELPPEIQDLLSTVHQALLESVRVPETQDALVRKFTDIANLLGQLAGNRSAQSAGSSREAPGLASLAHLAQEAAHTGKTELAQVLDDFLQTVGRAQWQNIPPTAQHQRQDWLEAALWMRLPVPGPQMENVPIRLRIDRPPTDQPQKVGASHAHIFIQVDLPDQQIFQVEVELNHRQLKADVTIPDDSLYKAAQEELGGLAVNLQEQGYSLGDAKVEVGTPDSFEKITVLPDWGTGLSGLDLEA